ncbi:MAG TPA: lysylphosphatidylglycerol synthase domain-containing protein [Vicinamibacterales bacterium]
MKRAFTAASTIVGAAAFVYSVSVLGAAEIRSAVVRIGWGFAAILVLSGLREAARALAWTQTFGGTDRLPFGEALRARLAGEALNTLLPMGFVVGEPVKAQHVADRLPFTTAFSALVVEFAFYSASLAILLFVAALAVLPPIGALGAMVALGAAAVPALKRAPRLVEPLRRLAVDRPRRAWGILALEASYHALGVAEVYVTLLFLVPGGVAWTSAVLLETVNRGVTIVFKMLPMRLGVDEASAALVTNRLALGSATGVMLALVRKLRLLFWAALGLGFIALRAGKHAARACATTA